MDIGLGTKPRTKMAGQIVGELVECWWNGRFGQTQRQDLWLKRFGDVWCAESRHGGVGGLRRQQYFSEEGSARMQLAVLKGQWGPGWKFVPVSR